MVPVIRLFALWLGAALLWLVPPAALAKSIVLKSGRELEISNTMVFYPTNGKAPTFQLRVYAGDGVSMAEMWTLSDIIFEEQWGPSAESYGFVRARIDLTSRPMSFVPFTTSVTLFYERGADGEWSRDGKSGAVPPKKQSEVALKSGQHVSVVERRIGRILEIKGKVLSIELECLTCSPTVTGAELAGIAYDAFHETAKAQVLAKDISGAAVRFFAKARTSTWHFPLSVSINGPRNSDGTWPKSIAKEEFVKFIDGQLRKRTEDGAQMRARKP